MKLKFKRFENNNETIECEIDGPFINNNNDIEFGLDEKKIVITGKNGSGKTQFISGILDSINAFNNDHNNNNKIFIGYLTHNLAFNFDKRRVSNVHELHIDDTLIELFNKLLNADIDKDILVNSFLIHNGKIGTPLEVFKPFNLLTFFIKFNIKYNNRSPVEDLNKELKSLGISENSITYENSSNKIILQKIPTSGELLFLNFLVVKWIHTKVKKFEILLFDEPDRHFEPKIVEKFFKILNDEFKDTRIFLTTHRPDTILLSQKDPISFKLCKLKQNENGERILEKYSGKTTEVSYRFFVLSTIFDLTYNLREIMNIKIRVYTESNDDYSFYNFLYHHLLDYCSFLRSKNDIKILFNKEFPILSRRYQLYFCTSASDIDGGKGGIDMSEYNQNRDSIQRGLVLKDIKNFWNGDFFKSYGIIDKDGDQFKNNYKRYSSKFQILKRYNIENYIVDPMFLHKNIKFKDNDIDNKFKNFKNILNDNNSRKKHINRSLKSFFKIFINEVLKSKNTKIKTKKIPTINYVKEYILKEIIIIDKLNKIREEKKLPEIKNIRMIMEDFVEKNTIHKELVNYLVKDCQEQTYYLTEKQSNNEPYFKKIDLNYPSIVLNIDGKVLEAVLKSLVNDEFSLISNLSQIENLWISQDVVEIFSSINNQARVYPICYLIETELKNKNQTVLERTDALEAVRKAGFTEKKFDACLQISPALKKMIS